MSQSAGRVQVSASLAGLSVSGSKSNAASQHTSQKATLAAGNAGTLTTRTDDNTGVATLAEDHTIETADVCDIYWSGGKRCGMTATVSTTAVTLDGGEGDVLPATSTAVVVSKQTTIVLPFEADDAKLILVHSDKAGAVSFRSTAGAYLLTQAIIANFPWQWVYGGYDTNPLAADTVADLVASVSGTAAGNLSVGIVVDSDS